MNKDTTCKWCDSGDLILAPAYPVTLRRVRCGVCHRKQVGDGCDCYNPTFCHCEYEGGD